MEAAASSGFRVAVWHALGTLVEVLLAAGAQGAARAALGRLEAQAALLDGAGVALRTAALAARLP